MFNILVRENHIKMEKIDYIVFISLVDILGVKMEILSRLVENRKPNFRRKCWYTSVKLSVPNDNLTKARFTVQRLMA